MTEVQRLAKIMVLKDMRKEYELRAKYNGGVDYDCYRALDMAINALEQEPCTDAISREDALQALCKAVHKNDDTIPCLNQRVSCLWDKTKVQDYAEEILKLPPVKPQYTDAEIQKMQDLESAEIQKAYEIGKAENIEVLDKIRSEIVHLHDWAYSREEILRIIDKYKESEDKEGGTQHDD